MPLRYKCCLFHEYKPLYTVYLSVIVYHIFSIASEQDDCLTQTENNGESGRFGWYEKLNSKPRKQQIRGQY